MPRRGEDLALDAADGDLSAYMRNLDNTCRAVDFSECGRSNEYEMSLVVSGAVWSLRGMAGPRCIFGPRSCSIAHWPWNRGRRIFMPSP